MKVKDIAEVIGGVVKGDGNLVINDVSGLDTAEEGDISFLSSQKFLDLARSSKASCLITKSSFSIEGKTLIYSEYPHIDFIKVINLFHPPEKIKPGISEFAVVSDDVTFGNNVSIAPFVVIERGVVIGNNVRIGPFTFLGRNVKLGNNVELKAQVTVLDRTIIGDRVIVHSGTVIGSDGYAYVTKDKKHHKIPQIGNVVIEDDCEIGANVTIDRASFGATRIKRGTKLDNLVQVGHNVTIGEDSLIVAQVGIAGSCQIGNNVILAGQVGVADHLKVGDGAIVAAQGGVTKDIPPDAIYSGYPARDHNCARRIYAASAKLPELLKRVKKIEKALDAIEKQVGQNKKDS